MVNFLIYLFIANAHKGKKKKNQSNESLAANKTHIDSQCICSLYKTLNTTALQEMETGTVYEHFRGDNSTGKRCLWAGFTMKERKLTTTSNKETSSMGRDPLATGAGLFS